MGYCPFSKFESRYSKLYCDTGPGRHGLGARQGRIVARHDTAQWGCDTASPRARHGRPARRGERQRAHVLVQPQLCHDTIFVSRRGRRPLCRDTTAAHATRPGALRQNPMCATTRRCARDLGAVRAQPGFLGCAHYVPNPILTQCTVYSYCLDHCSWTLFTGFFKKIKNK